MGNKQTKIGDSYLPDTPTTQQLKPSTLTRHHNSNCILLTNQQNVNQMNPRTPNGYRTPLRQFQHNHPTGSFNLNENNLGPLRKRWLKTFIYNLNDPRSPNTELNRTPLLLEENERTFSMNDTFADLFVGPRTIPESYNKYFDKENKIELQEKFVAKELIEKNAVLKNSSVQYEVATMLCPGEEPFTPIQSPLPSTAQLKQHTVDPRSPTCGLERTPIHFNDDDPSEDAILENLLGTISLDLTAENNVSSFDTPTCVVAETIHVKKNRNKHLKRVINYNKRTKVTSALIQNGHRIYEDNNIENVPTTRTQKKLEDTKTERGKRTSLNYEDNLENAPTTLKQKMLKDKNTSKTESIRIPLICLRNRRTAHSSSVEMMEIF